MCVFELLLTGVLCFFFVFWVVFFISGWAFAFLIRLNVGGFHRLATGARVLKDEVAAFRMLTCVAKGPYSRDKIALADNMLCYLYKKRFSRDAILENLLTALVFGDFASSNGPFTHCILTLASFFAPFRDIDPYRGFTSLWEKFDDYRERWGLMVPGQKCCSVCGAAPKKMKGLKRCAGSCLIPRKPLYCGKSCQKKVSPPPS